MMFQILKRNLHFRAAFNFKNELKMKQESKLFQSTNYFKMRFMRIGYLLTSYKKMQDFQMESEVNYHTVTFTSIYLSAELPYTSIKQLELSLKSCPVQAEL